MRLCPAPPQLRRVLLPSAPGPAQLPRSCHTRRGPPGPTGPPCPAGGGLQTGLLSGFCPGVGDEQKQATGSAQRRASMRRRRGAQDQRLGRPPGPRPRRKPDPEQTQGSPGPRGEERSDVQQASPAPSGARSCLLEEASQMCFCMADRAPGRGTARAQAPFHNDRQPPGTRAKQRPDLRSQGPLSPRRQVCGRHLTNPAGTSGSVARAAAKDQHTARAGGQRGNGVTQTPRVT